MPIYEFHCRACDQDSELLVPTTNWQGAVCPHCGAAKLEKQLSVFAPAVAEPAGGPPACAGPACGLNPAQAGCGGCCA